LNTRILLFGKNGHLGWELHRSLLPLGEVIALGREELDLVDRDGLATKIQDVQPDVIINAAAYTNVDKAESEPEQARNINALAPAVMAEEAKRSGALLIHYSTDYVFDGTKGEPYTERDEPNPINVYGMSKLEGEEAIRAADGANLILRTSWVYGLRKPSFVTKVLEWARAQEIVKVVDDQIGSPTWCRMLAEKTFAILELPEQDLTSARSGTAGTFHIAGLGATSRHAWAQAILESDPNPEQRIARKIVRANSHEFKTAASRPPNSALDCGVIQDIFNLALPDWKTSLHSAMRVAV
jgi:dTDP-4-dehydrorhamnose reductase